MYLSQRIAAQHREWTLMWTTDLRWSGCVCWFISWTNAPSLTGAVDSGEAVRKWAQGYMGYPCLYLPLSFAVNHFNWSKILKDNDKISEILFKTIWEKIQIKDNWLQADNCWTCVMNTWGLIIYLCFWFSKIPSFKRVGIKIPHINPELQATTLDFLLIHQSNAFAGDNE